MELPKDLREALDAALAGVAVRTAVERLIETYRAGGPAVSRRSWPRPLTSPPTRRIACPRRSPPSARRSPRCMRSRRPTPDQPPRHRRRHRRGGVGGYQQFPTLAASPSWIGLRRARTRPAAVRQRVLRHHARAAWRRSPRSGHIPWLPGPGYHFVRYRGAPMPGRWCGGAALWPDWSWYRARYAGRIRAHPRGPYRPHRGRDAVDRAMPSAGRVPDCRRSGLVPLRVAHRALLRASAAQGRRAELRGREIHLRSGDPDPAGRHARPGAATAGTAQGVVSMSVCAADGATRTEIVSKAKATSTGPRVTSSGATPGPPGWRSRITPARSQSPL